jgi:hypothetical protein
VIRGVYPSRITRLLTWGAGILAILLALRCAIFLLKVVRVLIPSTVGLPIFNQLEIFDENRWWWLIIAASILVFLMIGVIAALRNLLPELETRANGLAVRYFKNWRVIPWSHIKAIKVTEFSEESQIVLIQVSDGLPFTARLNSLIYDGGFTPGILITSALNTFEPLLQRIVLEITRHQGAQPAQADTPIFQNEARSPFLLLSFRAGVAIDQLVAELREDEESKALSPVRLLRAARPMFWLALPPALLMFCDRAIRQGILPDGGLVGGMIVLFLLSMLEWPLVCLISVILDEMTGGGEEGNRAFLLYPLTQLPRLLPLTGALIMVLLGVPILPVLFWIGAIGWSFLLAAGLWESLYDWRSGQLLAGGLVPVVFQLLILLAYLVVLR